MGTAAIHVEQVQSGIEPDDFGNTLAADIEYALDTVERVLWPDGPDGALLAPDLARCMAFQIRIAQADFTYIGRTIEELHHLRTRVITQLVSLEARNPDDKLTAEQLARLIVQLEPDVAEFTQLDGVRDNHAGSWAEPLGGLLRAGAHYDFDFGVHVAVRGRDDAEKQLAWVLGQQLEFPKWGSRGDGELY